MGSVCRYRGGTCFEVAGKACGLVRVLVLFQKKSSCNRRSCST